MVYTRLFQGNLYSKFCSITISGDNEGYSLQQLCDEVELRTKNSEIAGIEWMTKILQEINCNESRQLFAAANTSRTFLQP